MQWGKQHFYEDVLTLAHSVFISVISRWTARAAKTWWDQNSRGQTGSTGERTIPTTLLTGRVTFWRMTVRIKTNEYITLSKGHKQSKTGVEYNHTTFIPSKWLVECFIYTHNVKYTAYTNLHTLGYKHICGHSRNHLKKVIRFYRSHQRHKNFTLKSSSTSHTLIKINAVSHLHCQRRNHV